MTATPLTRAAFLLSLFTCGVQASTAGVADPAIFFSPYTTYSDGSGAVQPSNVRKGSTFVLWNQAGSYLKTAFTGTSVSLHVDTRTITEGEMPKVKWSVDDGPVSTLVLSRGQSVIPIADHLKPGAHLLLLVLAAIDGNYDRWTGPAEALKITSIELDATGQVVPLPADAIRPKRAVFFGDSITEGLWVSGDSFETKNGHYMHWVEHSDATVAWPALLAGALGAELGNCGVGGLSWVRPIQPFRPALPGEWDSYFAGHSRLVSGKLVPRPDYVFVNMGTNDGDADTSAAAAKWLRDLRGAVGSDTLIFVILPFGGQNRASVLKAATSAADKNTRVLDLGPGWSEGLHHYGQAARTSFDGLHPNVETNAGLAAALALRVGEVLAVSGPPSK